MVYGDMVKAVSDSDGGGDIDPSIPVGAARPSPLHK